MKPNYYDRLERMKVHHKQWIKLCGGRCPISGKPIGSYQGQYYPYACHHMNYGSDRFFWSVVPVSKEVHDKLLHGRLSGGRSAGEQWDYPNFWQQLVHFKARLTVLKRWILG